MMTSTIMNTIYHSPPTTTTSLLMFLLGNSYVAILDQNLVFIGFKIPSLDLSIIQIPKRIDPDIETFAQPSHY